MIRDPSDGSVKGINPKANEANAMRPKRASEGITSANNWGLKSLDKEARKPKPAPTAEELREHYAKHNLAFQPKTEGI